MKILTSPRNLHSFFRSYHRAFSSYRIEVRIDSFSSIRGKKRNDSPRKTKLDYYRVSCVLPTLHTRDEVCKRSACNLYCISYFASRAVFQARRDAMATKEVVGQFPVYIYRSYARRWADHIFSFYIIFFHYHQRYTNM